MMRQDPTRVLLVEDNPGDARLIAEMVSEVESGMVLEHVATLRAAIEHLADNNTHVVLLDLGLPDSQGVDTFFQLQSASPHVAVVVLSGNTNTHEAVQTVESGAQDFLVKGRVDGELIVRSVGYAAGRKDAERSLVQSEARLAESNAALVRMVYGVAAAMGRVVEARDPYTQGHQVRVARVAVLIATDMGLREEDIAAIEMAALVHDIGKMSIPAEILSKPGKLSEIEFNLIKQHPQMSYEILKGIDFPWPVAEIALQHHERFDGSGYPNGLTGEQTLPEARILAVADVVEAMASDRPYRPALGLEAAFEEITGRPGLYDPSAVGSCLRVCTAEVFEQ